MKRRFNQLQRNVLYLADGGLCASCGESLGEGWHADHKQPYSKGGQTATSNGQALCPKCNLEKGAKVQRDSVEYRPMQRTFIEATKNKIANDGRVLVANVAPGSGKTLAAQATVNELYRVGLIDSAIVLTPRLNLCQQFELDWKQARPNFAEPVMGPIVHRENKPPLLRDGEFGYTTTYQSLVTAPGIHFDFARRHQNRFALVLDEAQMLGSDGESGTGTQSAKYVEEIGQFARFIFVMSGTPYRADGKPLIFATYTDPDDSGDRYLEADVTATYREGVTEKYLREFEYELFDGQALYEYLSGGSDVLVVSQTKSGIGKIVGNSGYWGPLVDRTIEAVRDRQEIDGRFCGLIGAANQTTARAIIRYIEKHHKGTRAVLAVSDETFAQDNLRQFKTGKYDILVTVAMAHVGYDHKPICVVTALNSYRETGWLDQFFARGMRVMPDVSYELQTLLCIVPDDPKMAAYVEQKRQESVQGVREREKKERAGREDGGDIELGVTSFATVTDTRAMSLDPELDLSPNDFALVKDHKKKYNLGAVNMTGLGHLLRDLTTTQQVNQPGVAVAPGGAPLVTRQEEEKILRARLHSEANQCDRILGAPHTVKHGHTNLKMFKKFRKKVEECSKTEIEERLSWIRNTWKPQCVSLRNAK